MRELPRTVQVLVLARAVNRLGAFTLPFLGVLLVQEAGASLAQAGWVLAAFGLATIPSRLLGGRLADRLGARATIVLGLTLTAAAQLLVAASSTLGQATAAAVLLGLAFEVYEPPSQAMIADVTPVDLRPAAYGLLGAALAAAGVGAGLLAALLAGLDLRLLFVVDAATCLACAVAVVALVPGGRREAAPDEARAGVWSDRRLLAMLAVGTCFAIVYLEVVVILPLTLTLRGLDPSAVGLVLTVSAATMVLGQPLLGRSRLRHVDDFVAMALGFALLGLGLGLTGLATSLVAFLAATVVWSLGDLLLLGRAYTVVAGLAPEGSRGRYLAAYGTSWGVAAVVAPVLGTQLLSHAGPAVTWASLGAACLALASAQPGVRRLVGQSQRADSLQ